MTNIIIAGAVGLILSMLGTPLAIRLFARRGYGQEVREDGVQAHLSKKGTPTMGGVVFVLASLLAYGASHLVMFESPTISGLLVLFLMTGLGAVGFLDDFIKIYKQRSLGLRSGAKALGQLIVGAVFAVLVTQQANVYGITPAETRLSFLRDFGPSIGLVGFTIWVLIMIVGFSNAVNLTDGLDGLASGATAVVLGAYVLIGNWQLRNNCIDQLGPNCYWVRDPLDLAVVAAAVLGSLIGFLWWNAPPAKIFMGDTGSLALGGVLAGLAIATRTQLLLIILAGLCVIITMSVIIQVGFFKMT
ncbi:phospho-N-acetylmuramoyl-pentapeptide-transferase, partial [Nonomuraea sp. NPDC055795]